MTKQQAKELALLMQQRGYVITPPIIKDEVLAEHIKSRSEEQKATQSQKPEFCVSENRSVKVGV